MSWIETEFRVEALEGKIVVLERQVEFLLHQGKQIAEAGMLLATGGERLQNICDLIVARLDNHAKQLDALLQASLLVPLVIDEAIGKARREDDQRLKDIPSAEDEDDGKCDNADCAWCNGSLKDDA